jgi:hypothetical protein
MTHIMLDIETLGTKPGCAIASIGACVFSQQGVGDTFYRIVNISAGANGHPTWPSFDSKTISWWMQQSDEARSIFNSTEARHIVEVLHDLCEWCCKHGEPGIYLWCHGAPFDAPIVEAAYDALWAGDNIPWKFWNIRDTRTLYDISGVKPDRLSGTHHNALDDAKAQAEAVIAGYAALGKVLSI